jgi:hypothetical protein
MLEIAKKIIDQQKGEFDSTQFVDRYEEARRVLIEEKKASRSPVGGLRWVRNSICRPAGRGISRAASKHGTTARDVTVAMRSIDDTLGCSTRSRIFCRVRRA